MDIEKARVFHKQIFFFAFQVRESIESTSYDLDGIPAAEILFCCGFFLIYLIEELVHCLCDARVHSDDEATIHVHK